jgi:hypothetical protein
LARRTRLWSILCCLLASGALCAVVVFWGAIPLPLLVLSLVSFELATLVVVAAVLTRPRAHRRNRSQNDLLADIVARALAGTEIEPTVPLGRAVEVVADLPSTTDAPSTSDDDGGWLRLLEVAGDPQTPAATHTLAAGLDHLFRTLGPPPAAAVPPQTGSPLHDDGGSR